MTPIPPLAILRQRAGLTQAARLFFVEQGFLEVETPIRIPAPAPEAHIEPEPSADWYLQTSPELCMKRLLAAGAERIFQICKCFRRHERGDRHLPELTMLEWYRTGADYHDLMSDCEGLLGALCPEGRLMVAGREIVSDHGGGAPKGPPAPSCKQLQGASDARTLFNGLVRRPVRVRRPASYTEVCEQASDKADGVPCDRLREIDLSPPWPRLTLAQAFARHASLSLEEALATDRFEEILVAEVEPHLGLATPVFLCDFPASLASLARLDPQNPALAQRFELYINGLELANGFSELTDAVEQRRRFIEEQARIAALGRRPAPLPEPFLADLSRLPPRAAGIALGLDRLVMLLCGRERIDQVVAFTPEAL